MMPEVGRLVVRSAIFTGGLSALLLFFLDRGTPEFAITVITLVLAVAMIGLVTLLARRSQ